jgi:hypothetical protein
MNKLFAFCVIAATAAASAAQAQSTTFKSQQTSSQAVGGVRPDGTAFGGQMTTGTTETMAADGKKWSGTHKCMGVTMPPNDSTYNARLVCDNSDPSGTSSTIWGCTAPAKETKTVFCTGWAFGKTGGYEGRRGTMTFVGVDGSGSGTALWGK